jgi:hypothetical protein
MSLPILASWLLECGGRRRFGFFFLCLAAKERKQSKAATTAALQSKAGHRLPLANIERDTRQKEVAFPPFGDHL